MSAYAHTHTRACESACCSDGHRASVQMQVIAPARCAALHAEPPVLRHLQCRVLWGQVVMPHTGSDGEAELRRHGQINHSYTGSKRISLALRQLSLFVVHQL